MPIHLLNGVDGGTTQGVGWSDQNTAALVNIGKSLIDQGSKIGVDLIGRKTQQGQQSHELRMMEMQQAHEQRMARLRNASQSPMPVPHMPAVPQPGYRMPAGVPTNRMLLIGGGLLLGGLILIMAMKNRR